MSTGKPFLTGGGGSQAAWTQLRLDDVTIPIGATSWEIRAFIRSEVAYSGGANYLWLDGLELKRNASPIAASGVAGYKISVGSKDGGSPDILDNAFTSDTSYSFLATVPFAYVRVKSVDNAGNESDWDQWSSGPSRNVSSTWQYDGAGNRKEQTVVRNGAQTVSTYQYSDLNELKDITEVDNATGVSQGTSFEYDDNGNLTKKTITRSGLSTETWDYAYDNRNNLKSVSLNGTTITAYAFDIFGRRLKSVESGVVTVFLYSGNKVIYEERYALPTGTDITAGLGMPLTGLTLLGTTDYAIVGNTVVAKMDHPAGGSEVTTYFHQDHLGSTRLITDASGAQVGRIDYEAFGSILGGEGTVDPYAFTGQRRESATGLYYYGARFYDPAIGRFITADSWTNLPDDERGHMVGENPGGYNQYAYVLNNPVLFGDPTGHIADIDGYGRYLASEMNANRVIDTGYGGDERLDAGCERAERRSTAETRQYIERPEVRKDRHQREKMVPGMAMMARRASARRDLGTYLQASGATKIGGSVILGLYGAAETAGAKLATKITLSEAAGELVSLTDPRTEVLASAKENWVISGYEYDRLTALDGLSEIPVVGSVVSFIRDGRDLFGYGDL